MNHINTAILRLVSGNDALSITVSMHPFPRECLRGFKATPTLRCYRSTFFRPAACFVDFVGCSILVGSEMLSGFDDWLERSGLVVL